MGERELISNVVLLNSCAYAVVRQVRGSFQVRCRPHPQLVVPQVRANFKCSGSQVSGISMERKLILVVVLHHAHGRRSMILCGWMNLF